MPHAVLKSIVSVAAVIAMATPVAFADSSSELTYTVQPGDTLWKISQHYHVSISDLTSLNQMANPNNINVGEVLTLPLVSLKVQAGDTVSKIAKAYGSTVTAIANENGLANPNLIDVGQVLLVPSANAASTNASSPSSPATVPTPAPTQLTAPSHDTLAQQIVITAEQYKGPAPYVWGGSSPSGWDCSGFVWYVFQQNGITLPRTSKEQFAAGTAVDQANLAPADLVFFSNTTSAETGISHVGIYIGNGQFIEESTSQNAVVIASLSNPYWAAHYAGAKRVF